MSEARTVVSPATIRYAAGGHTFSYVRSWRDLTLRIDEYDLVRAIGGLERTFDDVSKPDDADLVVKAHADYDGMSADEKAAFADIDLREVKPITHTGHRLTGWATIEEKRSVRVFSAATKREPQSDYDRTFRRVRIALRSIDDVDHFGSLLLVGSAMRLYSDDPEDEDYLVLDVAIRSSALEQLAIDLSRLTEKPPLRIHIGALLHQSEVEQALSENRHPQSFAMLEHSAARAYVAHILLKTASRSTSGEDEIDLVERPAARPIAGPPATDVGKRIGSLTTAVWCLVAAVVVAAFLI